MNTQTKKLSKLTLFAYGCGACLIICLFFLLATFSAAIRRRYILTGSAAIRRHYILTGSAAIRRCYILTGSAVFSPLPHGGWFVLLRRSRLHLHILGG